MKKIVGLFVFILLFASLGKGNARESNPHILVITSQPYHTKWFEDLSDSIAEHLYSELSPNTEISYEYIGSGLIKDDAFVSIFKDYLRKKYVRVNLSAVVAVMPTSSGFLLRHGDEIFPGIPRVYALPAKDQIKEMVSQPGNALVESVSDIGGTVDRIRTLFPKTEHLYVVSGMGADDLSYIERTRVTVKNTGWPRDVTYLTGIPAGELAEKLSILPQHSAILMLLYVRDRDGKPLTTVQVMESLAPSAAAPVFGFYDTVLGLGIVGGRLTSSESYGEAIASATTRLLAGDGTGKSIRVNAKIKDMYDWRQLKKWNIPASLLPEGSIIRYRTPTFWEENREKIVIVLIIFFVQGALIVFLIISIIKSRKLTVELKNSEQELLGHREHLENMVRARTSELVDANERLKTEIEDRIRIEQMLLQSETKYRNLVESANSIILRWAADGRITFFNKYAQAFFGYREEEIVGRNILDTIVPPKDSTGRDLSGLAEDIALNPEAYARNVNENIRKNGERVWVAWANRPIVDETGKVQEILSVGNDITRLIETERELRRAFEELAVAKEQAEAADRLKSAFLATMSHELRTPLNSIIGFTGIILQGIVGPLNEEQKKQMNMVRGSAQHLLSLINDVLDISKIEAGQLQMAYENYNLRSAIEKTVESARPLADKKGLELTCAISPQIETINGDRRRVEQILLNLISNAIKFTEKGSVRVECEPDGDGVTIRVRDTGIGIRPEDMGTIFKDFRQIDSGMTRKYEGTGLGLSISKRLVELMGGQIRATSVWSSGSTFSFTLPKERKEA